MPEKKLTLAGLLKAVKHRKTEEKKQKQERKEYRERDMRSEAMDMNAFGAKEFWGE